MFRSRYLFKGEKLYIELQASFFCWWWRLGVTLPWLLCAKQMCYFYHQAPTKLSNSRIELDYSKAYSPLLDTNLPFDMVPTVGLEPITYWLQISCSTNWAKSASGGPPGFEPASFQKSIWKTIPYKTTQCFFWWVLMDLNHRAFRIGFTVRRIRPSLPNTHLLSVYEKSGTHPGALNQFLWYRHHSSRGFHRLTFRRNGAAI